MEGLCVKDTWDSRMAQLYKRGEMHDIDPSHPCAKHFVFGSRAKSMAREMARQNVRVEEAYLRGTMVPETPEPEAPVKAEPAMPDPPKQEEKQQPETKEVRQRGPDGRYKPRPDAPRR